MIAAVSAVIGFGAASCSDDDKDDDKGLVVPSPEVSDFDGERLTSVDYIHFSYNSNGTLRQIYYEEDDDKITIDYAKGTATFSGDGWNQVCKFTTTEKGYVSSITFSGMDDGEHLDIKYEFQYDGEGHLTKEVYNEVSTTPGSKSKYVDKSTMTLTWSAALLTNIEKNSTYEETVEQDGEVNTYTYVNNSDITYSYDNASENPSQQYTEGLVRNFEISDGLAYVGLCGKGPVKYPTAYVENDVQNDYSYTNNYTIEYILNDKGLVEKETVRPDFEYADVQETNYVYSSGSKAKAQSVGTKSAKAEKRRANIRKHIGLFGRRQ